MTGSSAARLLRANGPINANEIGDALALPQSTAATNVQVLHDSELIRTATMRAGGSAASRWQSPRPNRHAPPASGIDAS